MSYTATKNGKDKRIGLQYHNWTILQRIGKIKTHATYLCRCICGNEKIIKFTGRHLQSKSCGCKKYEIRYKRERGPKNKLKGLSNVYVRYIRDAKERNIEFNLNEDLFLELIKNNCYYCDLEPSNLYKYKYLNYEYLYSGIDRVDNTKGYNKENCVSCCNPCNSAKRSITPKIVYKVYHFLFKKDENV